MRLKRLAVSGLLAAALLVAPTAAHAESTDGTCRVGIVLPSKLALTGYTTKYGVRLTGDLSCFSHVTWDLSQGLISTGSTISFYRPDTSGFVTYLGGPKKVHALPRQGSYSLVQYTDPATGQKRTYTVVESGSNTMVVKYDSRIAWHAPKRSGKQLALRASAASISDSTQIFGSYGAWAKAKVRFQHKRAGRWQTVATVRTDAKGVARVTTRYTKGEWRAVTVDSTSTWGRATGTHRL